MSYPDPLKPPFLSRRLLHSASFAFLFVVFMTGLAGALRQPALSVFLHNEVWDDPFMVGLFYAVNAIMGMVLSQVVAYYSDRYPQRKQIILVSCLFQMLGCWLFAFNRDYYVLLFVGTLLTGLGSAVSPQTFALAREYSDSQQRDATMFNSVLRAQISLAWIVGPPLAFYLSAELGFAFMYSAAAMIFVISMVIIALMLPAFARKSAALAQTSIEQELREEGISSNRYDVTLLFIVCLLLWACNGMMFINIPIYIVQDLGLSEQLAGIMMGTAAGIEIPIMLIAGYCTRFVSKKTLMLIGILAGAGYYAALIFAVSAWQFIAIQLFNGIFVGIVASLGMLYFQDLMPYKMGSATTLFNNTIAASWILSGPLAGSVAKYWGYHLTTHVALLIALLSFGLMLRVRKI